MNDSEGLQTSRSFEEQYSELIDNLKEEIVRD